MPFCHHGVKGAKAGRLGLAGRDAGGVIKQQESRARAAHQQHVGDTICRLSCIALGCSLCFRSCCCRWRHRWRAVLGWEKLAPALSARPRLLQAWRQPSLIWRPVPAEWPAAAQPAACRQARSTCKDVSSFGDDASQRRGAATQSSCAGAPAESRLREALDVSASIGCCDWDTFACPLASCAQAAHLLSNVRMGSRHRDCHIQGNSGGTLAAPVLSEAEIRHKEDVYHRKM